MVGVSCLPRMLLWGCMYAAVDIFCRMNELLPSASLDTYATEEDERSAKPYLHFSCQTKVALNAPSLLYQKVAMIRTAVLLLALAILKISPSFYYSTVTYN